MIQLMIPNVGNEEIQAVREVFNSRVLTEGDYTRKFEAKVRDYVGSKFALATPSCTAAIELALRVLKIGVGDEVVIPDFTHPATADAVLSVGAQPVLTDVNEKDSNLDTGKVKSHFSKKTRCVIPVSLFGHPADVAGLSELQRHYNFFIVEDAACSLGAEINGKKVGIQADITCFSFHPRKIVTTGEGGMLVTNNQEWFERAFSIQHFGAKSIEEKWQFVQHGSNYKMSNILAAISIVQLQKLDKMISDRESKAGIYKELLSEENWIRLPGIKEGVRHSYQTFCIRLLGRTGKQRDRVIHELRARGIKVQIGSYALHLEPAFRDLNDGTLRISTTLFNECLALPLHHELSQTDQEYVCEQLSSVVRELG